MKRPTEVAFLLLTVLAAAAAAQAQTVYRCGNSYSQTPCPGNKAIDVSDPRSESQQAQTRHAAQRDARAAAELEARRLREERGPEPARTNTRKDTRKAPRPSADPHQETATGTREEQERQGGSATGAGKQTRRHGKDGKPPGYFTARPPAAPQPRNSRPAP